MAPLLRVSPANASDVQVFQTVAKSLFMVSDLFTRNLLVLSIVGKHLSKALIVELRTSDTKIMPIFIDLSCNHRL